MKASLSSGSGSVEAIPGKYGSTKCMHLKKCYNVLHFYMQVMPVSTPSRATTVFNTPLIHIQLPSNRTEFMIFTKGHKSSFLIPDYKSDQ